jgi:hypothetical protein
VVCVDYVLQFSASNWGPMSATIVVCGIKALNTLRIFASDSLA